MKKYNVLYWVHMSNVFTVEAKNEADAEVKVAYQFMKGEKTLDDLDIGDTGSECQGEGEDE